jgi:hypothetical protein
MAKRRLTVHVRDEVLVQGRIPGIVQLIERRKPGFDGPAYLVRFDNGTAQFMERQHFELLSERPAQD